MEKKSLIFNDPNYILLRQLVKQTPFPTNQIVQSLIKWKLSFSLKWYQTYCVPPIKSLYYIWKLLFFLVEKDDSSVTVASQNAIGSLLISLQPFHSTELIKSFSSVILSLPVSPNTSITVISTFTYLSKFVGYHKLPEFINSVCILHHFGADLKLFINYIPQLVKQMQHLGFEFHLRILRSLLSSCAKDPNMQFAESVVCLVLNYPKRLMSELMQFLIINNLISTIFALGSKLIIHDSLLKYIPDEIFEIMFNESQKVFTNYIENATMLENAVRILKKMIQIQNFPLSEKVQLFVNEINKKTYSFHIQRIILPLVNDINLVSPQEDDSGSVLAAKIEALSNFNQNFEASKFDSEINNDIDLEQITNNFDPKIDSTIIEILEKLVVRNDNSFSSICKYLSTNLNGLTQRSKFVSSKIQSNGNISKLNFIVNTILNNNNRVWVHQKAVLNFIDKNDQFLCEKFFPNYIKSCINCIIKSSLSSHDELSEFAREVASNFIGLDNIDYFIQTICKLDFFDDSSLAKIICLLNKIVQKTNNVQYNEKLSQLIPIITESMIDRYETNFFSDYLKLISAFSLNTLNDRHNGSSFQSLPLIFTEHAISLMQNYYFSLTELRLFELNTSNNSNKDRINFLSNISTDILTILALNNSPIFANFKNCLIFILKCTRPKFNLIQKLLPLFPFEILNYINHFQSNLLTPEQIEELTPLIYHVFNTTQDITITAFCVEFFLINNIDAIKPIINSIISLIHSKYVKTAFQGFTFLQAVDECSNTDKNTFVVCLISELPEYEKNLFALKIVQSSMCNFQQLLSIQFPFINIDKSPKECLDWLKQTQVRFWPLANQIFKTKIQKILKHKNCKIFVDNFELNRFQTDFINENPSFFDLSKVKENKNQTKKWMIFSNQTAKLEKHWPNYNESNNERNNMNNDVNSEIIRLPSLAPFLKRRIFVNCRPLLNSFFMFSYVRIPKEFYKTIYSKIENDEDLKNKCENYQKRLHIIDDEIEYQKFCFQFSCKSHYFKAILKYLFNESSNCEIPQSISEQIYSILLINVSKIVKSKHFFYLLRIMRFVHPKNFKKDAEILINNLAKASIYKDFLSYEMYQFLIDFGSKNEIEFFIEKFPFIMSFLISNLAQQIQQLIDFCIPSFLCLALKINSRFNIIQRIDQIPANFISQKIIDSHISQFLLSFLQSHNFYLSNPTDYLKISLNYRSSSLIYCYDFIVALFSMGNIYIHLKKYDEFFKQIVKFGYMIPNSIELVQNYYETRTDRSQLINIIDTVNITDKIYMESQRIENTQLLAHCFAKATSFYDTINAVICKLKNPDIIFYTSILIAVKFYQVLDFNEKENFLQYIKNAINNVQLDSRKKALTVFLTGNDLDLMLLYSMIESNDFSEVQKYLGNT